MSTELAEFSKESHADESKIIIDTSEATAMVTDTPKETVGKKEVPAAMDVDPLTALADAAESKEPISASEIAAPNTEPTAPVVAPSAVPDTPASAASVSSASVATTPAPTPAPVSLAIPSLIGTFSTNHVFSGRWGMSDAAHSSTEPGQTSAFEYKLVKPFVPLPVGEASGGDVHKPCSGKYAGHFYLMMNGKSIKVEENNLMLSFSGIGEGIAAATAVDDASAMVHEKYTVVGDGTNKFGKFSIKGTYTKGNAHLYKEYNYTSVSASSNKKRSASNTDSASTGGSGAGSPSVRAAAGGNGGTASKLQKGLDGTARPPPLNMTGLSAAGATANTPAGAGAATPGGNFTPREGSGRARRPSIHVIEAKADLPPPPLPKATPKATPKGTPVGKASGGVVASSAAITPSAAAAAATTPAGGSKSKTSTPAAAAATTATKPPLILSPAEAAAAAKRAESNRTQRLSQAMIKCNDLLKELMKHPSGVYFLVPVDPVRLQCPDYPTIIKQPMDFGTIKQRLEQGVITSMESFAEHVRLVFTNAFTYNIAEDSLVHVAAKTLSTRFEDKYTKISAALQSLYQDPNAAIAAAAKSGGKKTGAAAGAKHRASTGSMLHQKPAVGPSPYIPPSAIQMDASSHQLLEMQKMMATMQEEITKLRSQVMQHEVRTELENKKEAAQNPLTFEEKKRLISQIEGLPAHRMEQVVNMIRAAAPGMTDADDNVVIQMDDLDTFTLRRLQRFVEPPTGGIVGDGAIKKVRREGSTGTGAPRGRRPNPEKAAARAAAAAAAQAQQQARAQGGGSFFAPQSFDQLRAGTGAAGGGEDYDVGEGEDLDGTGFDLDMSEGVPGVPSQSSSSSSSSGHNNSNSNHNSDSNKNSYHHTTTTTTHTESHDQQDSHMRHTTIDSRTVEVEDSSYGGGHQHHLHHQQQHQQHHQQQHQQHQQHQIADTMDTSGGGGGADDSAYETFELDTDNL